MCGHVINFRHERFKLIGTNESVTGLDYFENLENLENFSLM